MILTVEQLKRIVSAGGSLSLDASSFTLNQVVEIAEAAQAGRKGSLTLHNVAGINAAQLTELAALAPGLVTFDLAS
jgi:hypothetical protein